MDYPSHLGRLTGDVLTAAQLNVDIRDNMNAGFAVGVTRWSAYTATWTSTGTAPAIGNGVHDSTYCRIGMLVVCSQSVILGSTSTVGTGNYLFALPVAAQDVTSNRVFGSGSYHDATGNVYITSPIISTSTTVYYHYHGGGVGVVLAAAVPVVPANGDQYAGVPVYEAA